MVFQTIVRFLSGKRIPLIKFRKGGNVNVMSAAGSQQPQSQVGKSSPAAATRLPTIEDWQLPARYRRKPIDAFECEFINRGGPA